MALDKIGGPAGQSGAPGLDALPPSRKRVQRTRGFCYRFLRTPRMNLSTGIQIGLRPIECRVVFRFDVVPSGKSEFHAQLTGPDRGRNDANRDAVVVA